MLIILCVLGVICVVACTLFFVYWKKDYKGDESETKNYNEATELAKANAPTLSLQKCNSIHALRVTTATKVFSVIVS